MPAPSNPKKSLRKKAFIAVPSTPMQMDKSSATALAEAEDDEPAASQRSTAQPGDAPGGGLPTSDPLAAATPASASAAEQHLPACSSTSDVPLTALPWCSDVASIVAPLLNGELGTVAITFRVRGSFTLHRDPQKIANLLQLESERPSSSLGYNHAITSIQRNLEVFVLVGGRGLYCISPETMPVLPLLAALVNSPRLTKIIYNARYVYQLLFCFLGTARVYPVNVVDVNIAGFHVFPSKVLTMGEIVEECPRGTVECTTYRDTSDAASKLKYTKITEDLISIHDFYRHQMEPKIQATSVSQQSGLLVRRNAVELDTDVEIVCAKMSFHGVFFDAAGASDGQQRVRAVLAHMQRVAHDVFHVADLSDHVAVHAAAVKYLPGEEGIAAAAAASAEPSEGDVTAEAKVKSENARAHLTRLAADATTSAHCPLVLLWEMHGVLGHLETTIRLWCRRNSSAADGDAPALVRMHSYWSTKHNKTGRIFSSLPNLQTIPKKQLDAAKLEKLYQILSPEAETSKSQVVDAFMSALVTGAPAPFQRLRMPILREFFVAPPGTLLLSFDYNQMELRLLAHFSGDIEMLAVFQRKGDILRRMAMHIFQKENEESVTPEERQAAKKIVYGVTYGMGANALQEQLSETIRNTNISASEVIHIFYSSFPKFARFLQDTKRHAQAHHFFTSISGHRRSFPDVSDPATLRLHAVSYLIQSSAADILKNSLLELDAYCASSPVDGSFSILMALHDEVVLAVDERNCKHIEAFLGAMVARQRLQFGLSVDLDITVRIGRNFDLLK